MAKRSITLGPDKWPVDENGKRVSYWEYRRELLYYSALANFVRIIGDGAESMIDVGAATAECIRWFDWIPDRVTLDIRWSTPAPGIRTINSDFLTWEPDKRYDVVLCSQVLEHIEDVEPFARKLLAIGDRVLITVPHNWRAGAVPTHIHDPVSLDDVIRWTDRNPDYHMTVREPFGEERLFCFYNNGTKIDRNNASLMSKLLSYPITRT